MNDLIKLTVDELREIVYDQLPQGYPQPSKEEEALAILARRAQANDAMRATLSNWCVQFGAALCPTAGSADSFGDGMRAAKEQVSRILAAAPTAASSGAPAPADPWTPVQCDYDRNIHANQDANAWADFFVQVHPGLADKHDLMRAWFANAMMAMHDSPRCKPAPADSQREAVIEEWRDMAMQDSMDADGNYVGFTPCAEGVGTPDELFALRREEIDEAVSLMRSAPPAPVAPVTEGEVEAAISLFGGAAIGQCDEATYNGRKDALRALIARRVEEARGAGLRELRARLLSTAGSLPNRQMGHSDEDFDRGYVEACENWAQEIDRLLAAPPASQLAEEPAPEVDWLGGLQESLSQARKNATGEPLDAALLDAVHWLRDGLLSQAHRIEALERAAQGGSR